MYKTLIKLQPNKVKLKQNITILYFFLSTYFNKLFYMFRMHQKHTSSSKDDIAEVQIFKQTRPLMKQYWFNLHLLESVQ